METLNVMRRLIVAVVLLMGSVQAFGYISGIAIQTDKHSNMQVFVNGKLYNKEPGSFVRIKSQPGLFHLEIKVLNPRNRVWYVIKRDVRVVKGFEFFYKVEFENNRPELKEVRKYPVYSPYFLNPTLYNHHQVG